MTGWCQKVGRIRNINWLSWTLRRPVNGIFAFLALVINYAHSVVFDFFATPWTVAHQVPLSLGFFRQNTGVGCQFLLQGIFPTQGSNLHLPLWQSDSLSTEPPGKHGKMEPLELNISFINDKTHMGESDMAVWHWWTTSYWSSELDWLTQSLWWPHTVCVTTHGTLLLWGWGEEKQKNIVRGGTDKNVDSQSPIEKEEEVTELSHTLKSQNE